MASIFPRLVILAGVIVGWRTPALAQAEAFGTQGQWVISADSALDLSLAAAGPSTDQQTRLQVRPSAALFIIDKLSLGAVTELKYIDDSLMESWKFGIGLRLGYSIVLSEQISFWPQISMTFTRTRETFKDIEDIADAEYGRVFGGVYTQNAIMSELFAPLLFHPAPHFFLGAGPFVAAATSRPELQAGLHLALGGTL